MIAWGLRTALMVLVWFGVGVATAHASVELDRSFGVDGTVTVRLGQGVPQYRLYGLETLVSGPRGSGPYFTGPHSQLGKVRSDATLDLDYGVFSERRWKPISPMIDTAVDSRGRVVGLAVHAEQGVMRHYIYRFTRRGQLDPTFANQGELTVASTRAKTGRGHNFMALTIDSEGRYVVGGMRNKGRELLVQRYLPRGVLDRSFGQGGSWRGSPGWRGVGGRIGDLMALQGGRVLVAGSTPMRSIMLRLDERGRLDRGFGKRGYAFGTCGPSTCERDRCIGGCGGSKLVPIDRKYFFLFHENRGSREGWGPAIYRYRWNGSRDRRFARKGVLPFTMGWVRRGEPDAGSPPYLLPGSGGIAPLRKGRALLIGKVENETGSEIAAIEIDRRGRIVSRENLELEESLAGRWGLIQVLPAGKGRFYLSGEDRSDRDDRGSWHISLIRRFGEAR